MSYPGVDWSAVNRRNRVLGILVWLRLFNEEAVKRMPDTDVMYYLSEPPAHDPGPFPFPPYGLIRGLQKLSHNYRIDIDHIPSPVLLRTLRGEG